jgi:hypothetical protein
MAAPHAAGVAAIVIGENGGDMHPALVRRELRERAVDVVDRGPDEVSGWGLVTSGY